MRSLVLLMIENEHPEGISARKLVVETAKHNVLTAYNHADGIELLQRFPKVDAVLVHALVGNRDRLIADVLALVPEVPIIVTSPVDDVSYRGATYVLPSHEPGALLALLAKAFGASTSN